MLFYCFRIEHKDSRLGPFQHNGQIPEVINKGCYANANSIDDIDHVTKVKEAIKTKRARFAFANKEKCLKFIRNSDILDKHGFVLAEYQLSSIEYYHPHDDQVVFDLLHVISRKERQIS